MLATTKKKKKKKDKIFKVSNLAPCCYGCGAPLHTSEVDSPGYVDQETYDLVWKLAWNFLVCFLIMCSNVFVIRSL